MSRYGRVADLVQRGRSLLSGQWDLTRDLTEGGSVCGSRPVDDGSLAESCLRAATKHHGEQGSNCLGALLAFRPQAAR